MLSTFRFKEPPAASHNNGYINQSRVASANVTAANLRAIIMNWLVEKDGAWRVNQDYNISLVIEVNEAGEYIVPEAVESWFTSPLESPVESLKERLSEELPNLASGQISVAFENGIITDIRYESNGIVGYYPLPN